MVEALQQWLNSIQSWLTLPTWAVSTLILLGFITAGLLLDWLLSKLLLPRFKARMAQSRGQLTAILWNNKVLSYLIHLLPGLLLYYLIPFLDDGESLLEALLLKACFIYLGIFIFLSLLEITNVIAKLAQQAQFGQRLPIRSIQQLIKLMVSMVFLLFIIGILLNENPLYLISGLGAFTAILLVVFKDTILGFVGGIQLAANDMVRQGDWVEMAKYGADGNVIDVGLTTVKIQNWDKTITTVPTHAMISDAFKNWRGMENAQGRRIKRAVRLDINSIGFLSEQQWQELMAIQLIAKYLDGKQQVLKLQGDAAGHPINQRQLTNLGTFRAYLQSYLTEHPKIHQEMTLMVRQLAPTEHGLPLEIYCFCRDKAWVDYEAVQADIFDHIYAVLPSFGLTPYQLPSGNNLLPISEAHTHTQGA